MTTRCNRNPNAALTGRRHPTRQAVLIAHTEAVIHETGAERTDLALAIARQYHAQVPREHQSLNLELEPQQDDVDAYVRWVERTRKAVERLMTGAVRLPVEIEDAWVAALPQPYRSRCIQALVERMDHLAVEIPDEGASTADLGRVMKEAGEEVHAAGEVFADGRIDERDIPYLPDAERRCRESAAASLALATRLRGEYERLTGDTPDGGAPIKAVK